MRFRASANTSAAVSKGCSRISLRTKLAFFIPALRDLRASSRSSSSVNRTVRIAIVELIIDVCHLYVNRPMLDLFIATRRRARRRRQAGTVWDTRLVTMERPAPDLQSAGYALDRERPAAQSRIQMGAGDEERTICGPGCPCGDDCGGGGGGGR